MKLYYTLIILGLTFFSCKENTSKEEISEDIAIDSFLLNEIRTYEPSQAAYPFKENPHYKADSFDYPVGKPDAKGYYNAQKFGENNHLGDDWNATTGGNTDLGDPIHSIANGYVHFAENIGGGWGNVIRIWHQMPDGKIIESLYAHCDEIAIIEGQLVRKGDQIGTIGNCNGMYYAHLHFEIRDDIELPIGGGYSENKDGYLDPTEFIKANR